MSKEEKLNEHLAWCRKSLAALNYCGISYITDNVLREMLFESGDSRLTLLKWAFNEMFIEKEFDDNNFKEELVSFAVTLGFCQEKEKYASVLGEGPDVTVSRQMQFWQQIFEAVEDMNNYNKRASLCGSNSGDFLKKMVTSGTLQTYLSTSKNINICPALLDTKSLHKGNKSTLEQKLGDSKNYLEKLHGNGMETLSQPNNMKPQYNSEDMQNHISNLVTLSEAAQNIALPGCVKCTPSSTETQALTATLTQAGRLAPTVTKVFENSHLSSHLQEEINKIME